MIHVPRHKDCQRTVCVFFISEGFVLDNVVLHLRAVYLGDYCVALHRPDGYARPPFVEPFQPTSDVSDISITSHSKGIFKNFGPYASVDNRYR